MFGGACWTKSELFLKKIRTANFDAPPHPRLNGGNFLAGRRLNPQLDAIFALYTKICYNANKVGVLAAVATKEFGISITGLGTFTQALAFIVGYAGRDFLENLYKIVLKKTSIYEIPAVLQKQ